MSSEIERRLRSLRLSGMASVLSGKLIQAEKGNLTHLEFLELLGGAAAAGAILDRFLHHAEVITITGPSYRLHERKKRASARETVLDGQKR